MDGLQPCTDSALLPQWISCQRLEWHTLAMTALAFAVWPLVLLVLIAHWRGGGSA
jgi:hypothetical protein